LNNERGPPSSSCGNNCKKQSSAPAVRVVPSHVPAELEISDNSVAAGGMTLVAADPNCGILY